MTKKILVTGGNGFVGRALCRRLLRRYKVYTIDSLRYGNYRLSAPEYSALRIIVADICDRARMREILQDVRPDVLIHLAAIHYIPECEENPAEAVKTNVYGTVNMLSQCPLECRFVFASSGAVYSPSNEPHDEDKSTIGPTDVYGYAKLQGEQYTEYFAKKRGIAAVIVRLFNVVGRGETNPHVVPEIFAQISAGLHNLRLGNVKSKRDFIHVEDAAAGFAAVAVNGDVRAGESLIVNLGSNKTYSVEQILQTLGQISSREWTVEKDTSRVRESDRPTMKADITRIYDRFNWYPRRTLGDALSEMWIEPELPPALLEKYGNEGVGSDRCSTSPFGERCEPCR